MLPALRERTASLKEDREDAFMHYFDTLRNDVARVLHRRWSAFDWDTDEELTAVYPVDVYEQNNKIIVDAELPGFKKDEIEASVENDVLQICAEHKTEKKNGKSHLHERRYKRIERRFTLPAAVQEGKVKARYKDGILHLELPKSQKSKAAQIAIE